MTDQTALSEIVDQWTGEIISATDVDQLWELYQQARQQARQCRNVMDEVRLAFKQLSPPPEGSRTARVTGGKYRVMVIHPGPRWENSILKEALASFPHLGSRFMRIARVEPVAKEMKKLENEEMPGSPAFAQFKKMVMSAKRPPAGLPTIEVEK